MSLFLRECNYEMLRSDGKLANSYRVKILIVFITPHCFVVELDLQGDVILSC